MKFELTPVVFAVLQLLNSADAEFDEAHTRELAVALGGLDDRFGATALKGTQLGGLGNMGYSRTIGDIGGLGSNLGKMGYTRAGMGGNTRLGGLGLARPYSSNIGYGNNLLSNTLGSNLRYNNMGTSGLDLGVAAQRAQPIRSNIGYSNLGTNFGNRVGYNTMGTTGLGVVRPLTRTIGSTGLGRASRTGLGNIGYGRGIGSSNIGTIGYGNNLGRVGTIGNTRTGLVGYGKGGRVGRAWGNPAHGGYNVYGPGYSSTSSHQKTGYSTGTNTGNPQLTNLGY